MTTGGEVERGHASGVVGTTVSVVGVQLPRGRRLGSVRGRRRCGNREVSGERQNWVAYVLCQEGKDIEVHCI